MTAYQDRVYNTCLRMCGRAEDAEDYSQEAFARAYSSLSQFDGRSRFYTWLFRIAVNLILSGRRKTLRVRGYSLDAGATDDDDSPAMRDRLASREADPSQAADVRERHARVIATMEELDDHERAIIILRDIEALDYTEIATVLNVAPGTVKSRLHRARMALREKLGSLVETESD